MSKQNGKHLHIYERIRERPKYYRCIHPDCTHYMHRMYLKSKRATCYVCGDSFVISPKILQYAKLRCEDCRVGKPKDKEAENKLMEMIKKLGVEVT